MSKWNSTISFSELSVQKRGRDWEQLSVLKMKGLRPPLYERGGSTFTSEWLRGGLRIVLTYVFGKLGQLARGRDISVIYYTSFSPVLLHAGLNGDNSGLPVSRYELLTRQSNRLCAGELKDLQRGDDFVCPYHRARIRPNKDCLDIK